MHHAMFAELKAYLQRCFIQEEYLDIYKIILPLISEISPFTQSSKEINKSYSIRYIRYSLDSPSQLVLKSNVSCREMNQQVMMTYV